MDSVAPKNSSRECCFSRAIYCLPMAVYGNRWEEVRNLRSGGQGLTVLVRDRTGVDPGECVLKRLKNVESAEPVRTLQNRGRDSGASEARQRAALYRC